MQNGRCWTSPEVSRNGVWRWTSFLFGRKGPYMDLLPPGVRIVDLDAHRALASVPRLRRYLRGEAPCVLLATLPEACVAARVATWLGRVDVPLVPTAR